MWRLRSSSTVLTTAGRIEASPLSVYAKQICFLTLLRESVTFQYTDNPIKFNITCTRDNSGHWNINVRIFGGLHSQYSNYHLHSSAMRALPIIVTHIHIPIPSNKGRSVLKHVPNSKLSYDTSKSPHKGSPPSLSINCDHENYAWTNTNWFKIPHRNPGLQGFTIPTT